MDNDIDEWFDKFQIKDKPRKIFNRLWEYINSLDKACFYKVGKANAGCYYPERVFILLFPGKSLSFVYLTTDSATINFFRVTVSDIVNFPQPSQALIVSPHS